MITAVLQVYWILFQRFPDYARFVSLEDPQRAALLSCMGRAQAVSELLWLLVLLSILHTHDTTWFFTEGFLAALQASYAASSASLQLLSSRAACAPHLQTSCCGSSRR